ncbi:MAG: PQQ-dependent sugar dehydrogenase [Cyclobacteriaceae bacterium]|nr:PQQ-dependent sugar dehydrogenase [Cyclobacteriaceae bacterium]
MHRKWSLSMFLIVTLACQPTRPTLPPADSDNGGLSLPGGFSALVVIDSLKGRARQLTVNSNGDVYVKLRFGDEQGGNAALRDTTGDGKADIVQHFGQYEGRSYGTEMMIHDGYLYFSSELEVMRIKLDDHLIPKGEIEKIVIDDHEHGMHEHIAKPLAFDREGHMYVPYGAPSNACQEPKRTPGAPGQDPCPQLEQHGGVWQFDANKIGQTQKDGKLYTSGIRSVVAMDWNTADDNLYIVIHGRDDLLRLFSNVFSPWQSAIFPSEEFVRAVEGSNFGWPYCYYDQEVNKKVLAPEYGGDGDSVGRCADYDPPLIGFPGHWAPNELLFYRGEMFPERYKNGAFIAFHGSTNRAPYPQAGYIIVFVPFEKGEPSGDWEVFADGFAGVDPIVNVSDAHYRPMGLAEGPDGSLYISDTEKGKIWRVMYTGDKDTFGADQLAGMEAHKQLSHIRTPDVANDNLQKENTAGGEYLYYIYCGACHQGNGKGASGRFPPLANSEWVTGDKERLINTVLKGLEGPIEVNGESYNSIMPQHSFLNDKQVSAVLTYIRQNFGNEADGISEEEVRAIREQPKEP